ncbi:MAG: integrase [Desulfuromonadales bacterium C00003068]|jgi:Xaa-Pro aminopeptidase|nr:MAG: integrase [Desulfuromonadales bacterium C00003068]
MLKSRVNRLRDILRVKNLDALLLQGSVNLRYFCGFTGSDGALLVTLHQTLFLTDSRYTTQAKTEVLADDVLEYSDKLAAMDHQFNVLLVKHVGFESKVLSVDQFHRLENKCSTLTFQAVDDELSSLRQIKDEEELSFLDEAARLNCVAFQEVFPRIQAGMTEREVALDLEFTLRRLGGEDKAFDLIVASGVRGALPHGIASDKKIECGELVTIDFGTRCNGYYSDETVTFGVGNVSDQLRTMFDVVLHAHDLALESLEIAVAAKEVDRVARDYIHDHGFGEYFGHGLGHGVGLEVHESPTLSPRSEVRLGAGMVFTVEPGIYVPGVGGVRIEDTVLLSMDGYRCLTQCQKSYRAITCT